MSDDGHTALPELDSFSLGEIAHVEMGQSPDSRFVFDDPFLGHPFLQGNAEFGGVNPTPKYGCSRPAKLCKANDVLISVRAPVGALNIADRDYCIGRGLAAIRAHGIKPSLLAEVMARQSRALRRIAQGTTFEAINKNDLLTLPLKLPAKGQLSRIAEILDTLDAAICETEAIVAKLKAVKQGLLHDLLTRGSDSNGEVRPRQAEAPHKYKRSPIGWIPEEWDAVRIADDAEIEHGFAFSGQQFTDQPIGPALLVPGNFHRDGGLYFTSENTKFFSGRFSRRYCLTNGDVLIVMTDLSPMTLILGRTVVLNESFEVLHNQRIGRFRFKSQVLWNSTFFAEAMNQDAVRNRVIAEATGTTVRHTSPGRIRGCYVARPKLSEQKAAVEQLAGAEGRRRLEEFHLIKLRSTKSGLMDDLLTGRVRVTPPL